MFSQRTKKARYDRPSTVLGRLGGSRVRPSQTTLAKTAGPFSGKKYVDFIYENGLTKIGGAVAFTPIGINCNAAYDVDPSTYLGNKQPLYYDQLCAVDGPYQVYKVISWKTTWTISNNTAVPVSVYVHGALSNLSEFNSLAEAENYPGVKRLYLGAAGDKSTGTVTVTGHIKDYNAGAFDDRGFSAAFNAAPSLAIFGTCLVATADGATTTSDVYIAVKHEMYTELQQVDAIVS